jgi:hypothetical protein
VPESPTLLGMQARSEIPQQSYRAEKSGLNPKVVREVNQRGGRDLKVRRPAGQAWTPTVVNAEDAKNRGLTVAVRAPKGPCRPASVSEAVARIVEALDEGQMAEVRVLLEGLKQD